MNTDYNATVFNGKEIQEIYIEETPSRTCKEWLTLFTPPTPEVIERQMELIDLNKANIRPSSNKEMNAHGWSMRKEIRRLRKAFAIDWRSIRIDDL